MDPRLKIDFCEGIIKNVKFKKMRANQISQRIREELESKMSLLFLERGLVQIRVNIFLLRTKSLVGISELS